MILKFIWTIKLSQIMKQLLKENNGEDFYL